MRFQLDPFSPSGVSVQAEPVKVVQQSSGHGWLQSTSDLPTGGVTDQVLQKSANGVIWGVAITVSSTAPSSPSLNDLWVDTT